MSLSVSFYYADTDKKSKATEAAAEKERRKDLTKNQKELDPKLIAEKNLKAEKKAQKEQNDATKVAALAAARAMVGAVLVA